MVPDPKTLDAVLQGQLKARRATSSLTLEVSDDHWPSTTEMVTAVAPLRSLSPYEPGADEPGIDMLSSSGIGEENDRA